MTAIDPRTLDLIHAEIDGINSESERARLKDLLAGDAAAREYFARMQRLFETLASVEDLDPPADLRQDIMRSVHAAKTRTEAGIRLRLRALWPEGRSLLRYGYAFAAGAILGIAGLQWYVMGTAGVLPVALSEVAGTMTPLGAPEGSVVLKRIPLDLDDLTGTIFLLRSTGGLALVLDVHTIGETSPVRVALGFDPAEVGFTGFSQADGQVRGFSAESGQIALEMLGHHQLTVQLETRKRTGSELRLQFTVAGAPVGSLSLSLSGSP